MIEYKVTVFSDRTEWRNLKGQLHREGDLPAIEYNNGYKLWFLYAKLSRINAAAIEYVNGDKSWFLDGKYYRENGPAVERGDKSTYWFSDGKLHKEDGPAVEDPNGSKHWYLNGIEYSEKEYWKKVKSLHSPSCDGKIVEIDGKKYKLQEI